MANTQYTRQPHKFACKGLNVTMPPDVLPEGKFTVLDNVRSIEKLSTLQTRAGIQLINSSPMALTDKYAGRGVNSIRRLNDPLGADGEGDPDYTYIVGSGEKLYYGNGAMTDLGPVPIGSGGTFTGKPKSMIPWRPSNSPRAWMYIADQKYMVKVGREHQNPSYVMRIWGIYPPVDPPQVYHTTGTGALSGTIHYRIVYRSSSTGTYSPASPEPVDGNDGSINADGTAIVVSISAPADPQVDLVDIYRFGGALLNYVFVGTIHVVETLTFVDNNTDSDLESVSDILDTSIEIPFTTVGVPLAGKGTMSSYGTNLTKITVTSGNSLINAPINPGDLPSPNNNQLMAPGTIANINGADFAFYKSTYSNTEFIVVGVPIDNGTGIVTWRIDSPILMAMPMPYMWGPYQNRFFGCGDIYRPGYLYWTNASDPETTTASNNLEITTPSEPLMNGFSFDGKTFVFSSDRLFVIYPSFSSSNEFTALETPCQRGLLIPWAFACSGIKQGGGSVYFLAKDGIYSTQGGEATCITDTDLYWLFPHEGTKGKYTNGLYPIDFVLQRNITLACADGFLYFNYIDTQEIHQTLVYDTRIQGWFHDNFNLSVVTSDHPEGFQTGAHVHYMEEGSRVLGQIIGCDDGNIYRIGGNTDNGNPIKCHVRTASEPFGDTSLTKFIGDNITDLDTGNSDITVYGLMNNEQVSLPATIYSANTSGRRQYVYDINQAGKSIAMDYSWQTSSSSALINQLYLWNPASIIKPADSVKRIEDWHEFINGGDDAYVTGIRIWCDTTSSTAGTTVRQLQIWADETNTGNTITVTASGEQKLEFSWPQFKGKLGRLVPIDSAGIWKVFKWEWIATAEPLLIQGWDTNWQNAIQSGDVAYVTGCKITYDVQNITKTIRFQSELEGIQADQQSLQYSNQLTGSGRVSRTFAFTPFRATQLRVSSSDGVLGRLYNVEWIVQDTEKNPLSNWNANWEDGGYLGAKFLQGVVIDADTSGIGKTVDIEYEGGILTSLVVNHTKRMGVGYSFPYATVANKFRCVPRDSNPSWFYGARWIWEPHPELVTTYETQDMTHGMSGYLHLRDGYIPLESNSDSFLIITYDSNQSIQIQIPSTNMKRRKCYITFPAIKAKLFKYKLTTIKDDSLQVLYTATLEP